MVATADPPAAAPAAAPPGTETVTLLAEVRRHCVIVYAEFRGYEGHVKLDEMRTLLGGVDVSEDDVATPSSVKVLPADWRRKVNLAESQTKTAILRVGTLFKKGVYLVPREKYVALTERLAEIRRAREATVDQLVAAWPTVQAEFADKLRRRETPVPDAVIGQILAKLPDAAALRKKFGMDVGVWPVGTDGGGSYGLVDGVLRAAQALDRRLLDAGFGSGPTATDRADRAAAAELRRLVEALAQAAGIGARKITADELTAHIAAAQEVTDRAIREAVTRTFDEPRRELAAAVENFLDLAARERTIGTASLAALQAKVDRLQSFAWLAPDALRERINALATDVGRASRNDFALETDLSRRLVASLREIGPALVAAPVVLPGGWAARVVDLD